MKKLLLGVLASLMLFSCSEDESPLADFTITVSGESPNAKITITNYSTGAKTYSWEFGEGADISSSIDETPSPINVEKAGDFSITLIVNKGEEDLELTKTVVIPGFSAINYWQNIEFATAPGSVEYGRFFVGSTGQIIKDSEITSENGSQIDIAYNQFAPTHTVGFFSSPDNIFDDFVIQGAVTTQVINYVTDEFSTADFDSMNDDSLLNTLEIINDESAVGMSEEIIILFKTADNRKGVIKTKALNSARLLVDIKMQKY